MAKRVDSRFTNEELQLAMLNWQQIADKNGIALKIKNTEVTNRSIASRALNVEDKNAVSTSLFSFEMEIPFMDSTICIVGGESKFPELKYKFSPVTGLEFSIWEEDFTDRIAKWFGMTEMEVGLPEFDRKYLIKTNNKFRLDEVIDDSIIRYLTNFKPAFFRLEDSELKIVGLVDELSFTGIAGFIGFCQHLIERIKQ